MVFAVVVDSGAIADEVLVFKRHLWRVFRSELVAIVHEVPACRQLQVEVLEVEVDGRQLSLKLVVKNVVGPVAFHIDVYVVAAELVADGRTCEAGRVDGQVDTCLQTLAQSEGDVGVDRHGCLQRDVEAQLHGGILLGVEAEPRMQLHVLAVACREHHAHTVAIGHQTALGCLVEQVDAHTGGKLLLQGSIDIAVILTLLLVLEVEFLSDEPFVLGFHVLERVAGNALPLGEHLRTQRVENGWTERLAESHALLQADDVVPVAHGFLLTATDERVDGGRREAGRAIALGIYLHVQVGNGQVLVVFVLAIHVNNLTDDAHGVAHVVGNLRGTLHGDADDDVGTHLAGDVGRIVVFQTTVNQYHVTHSDGRESRRDGHRGTHGLGQPSAVETHLGVVDDVRSHTGKGDGQVSRKVNRVGVARTKLLEQLGKVFTLDESSRIPVALTDGHACGEEIGVLLLAVAETLPTQVLAVANHVAPVLHTHHRVECIGIVADGIEAADDAAHRRAGDDVDGDARPFQNLQHTDVGHALRTATAQHHAHLRPSLRRSGLFLCSILVGLRHDSNTRQHNCQHQYNSFHIHIPKHDCKLKTKN